MTRPRVSKTQRAYMAAFLANAPHRTRTTQGFMAPYISRGPNRRVKKPRALRVVAARGYLLLEAALRRRFASEASRTTLGYGVWVPAPVTQPSWWTTDRPPSHVGFELEGRSDAWQGRGHYDCIM